jgi:hypothetical protein
MRIKFPFFIDFFNWAIMELNYTENFNCSLDPNSLTSAVGLKLPKKCGSLNLSSKIKKEYDEILKKKKKA